MKRRIKFDGFRNGQEKEINHEAKMILSLLQKHYEVEMSETPDYIFCDVNSKEYYKYDGVRIFCTIEAICPDFNLCDYGIGFEQISFGDRYFRFPNFYFNKEITSLMADKHKNVTNDLAEREFCSFVYSNNRADEMRGKLFEKLSEYKKVDSGGRYMNNLSNAKPVEDKLKFEAYHKFSIACENASHPGYHTEKLAEAFAARTVPIYWGDPDVEKVFNSKAFINCNNYASIDEIVERVMYLDKHPEEYLEMLCQPALIDQYADEDGKIYSERKIEELEEYLVHIFDVPLNDAYRRNRGFWGKQYLQNYKSDNRVLERYFRIKEIWLIRILLLIKRKISKGE